MTIRVLAEFAPARDSVAWAEDAIKEFKTACDTFFNGDFAGIVTEFDANTGEQVKKLRLKKALPYSLRRKATECLNNSRHAFDQATFAARNLTGNPSNKSVYYPWSISEADLVGLLKRRGIDQRLWDTFRRHEPYPRTEENTRGDDLIRSLAKLANRKHTVGLQVYGDITHWSYPSITGSMNNMSLDFLTPKWDPVKNEAEILRSVGDFEENGDYQFRFQVVLQETGLPKPVCAYTSLREFNAKAKFVVESLQSLCLEICA